MDADERRFRSNKFTETIISAAFEVSNELGAGFLEKVYENALFHEISKRGLHVLQQHSIDVWYDGVVVGNYCVDLIVENEVLVELKVVKQFDDIHLAQCLNYLKATGKHICLLINFATPKVEIKRIVHQF
jgi:GxxExxY protein